MSSRSRWRKMKAGVDDGRGVCTCARCLAAIDRGEDVTCGACVEQACEIAYANGRADERGTRDGE